MKPRNVISNSFREDGIGAKLNIQGVELELA